VAAVLTLTVAAALLVRATVAEPYRVLTASMLPTLEPGDQVLVNKLAYRSEAALPARGDVVAFRSDAVALSEPGVPPVLMKRVIALPGDRVQMRGGLPVINGWQVPTCDVGEYVYLLPDGQGGAATGRLLVEFLDERAYLTVQTVTRPFPHSYEVKPGEVFVLGDNRGNSIDSRSYRGALGAGVPLAAIHARVERYLVGTHLDGRADWQRALRPVATGSPRLHVEGFDVRPLEEAIARCLRDAPKATRPPPPQGAFAAPPPLLQGGGM
jgi:signal peptidase I